MPPLRPGRRRYGGGGRPVTRLGRSHPSHAPASTFAARRPLGASRSASSRRLRSLSSSSSSPAPKSLERHRSHEAALRSMLRAIVAPARVGKRSRRRRREAWVSECSRPASSRWSARRFTFIGSVRIRRATSRSPEPGRSQTARSTAAWGALSPRSAISPSHASRSDRWASPRRKPSRDSRRPAGRARLGPPSPALVASERTDVDITTANTSEPSGYSHRRSGSARSEPLRRTAPRGRGMPHGTRAGRCRRVARRRLVGARRGRTGAAGDRVVQLLPHRSALRRSTAAGSSLRVTRAFEMAEACARRRRPSAAPGVPRRAGFRRMLA